MDQLLINQLLQAQQVAIKAQEVTIKAQEVTIKVQDENNSNLYFIFLGQRRHRTKLPAVAEEI
jgi:hypothetical protein